MAKNEDFHKYVVLFVKEYTADPEKLKKERERLKDKMFAYVHKVSVSTVRNYMGIPPCSNQEKRLSEEDIAKINIRRKSGEPDIKIALEYSMSSSTLGRHCGSRKSIGIKVTRSKSVFEIELPQIVYKKVPFTDPNIVLTEQQRLYEESWKSECEDSCKSIDISKYKR